MAVITDGARQGCGGRHVLGEGEVEGGARSPQIVDAELPDRFDFAVELGAVEVQKAKEMPLNGDGGAFADADDSDVFGTV